MGIVDKIIEQLKLGGPLKDPWVHLGHEHPYAGMALDDFVRIEVQRSIDRIQRRLTFVPPEFYYAESKHPNGEWVEDQYVELPKKQTAAKYRKAGRALREIGRADVAERLGLSDDVMQEPPPQGDALKHYCADEAFLLMEVFSAEPPTGTAGGPFREIARYLYCHITDCEIPDDEDKPSMKRACDRLLHRSNTVSRR
jgi:hypothetical protein